MWLREVSESMKWGYKWITNNKKSSLTIEWRLVTIVGQFFLTFQFGHGLLSLLDTVSSIYPVSRLCTQFSESSLSIRLKFESLNLELMFNYYSQSKNLANEWRLKRILKQNEPCSNST